MTMNARELKQMSKEAWKQFIDEEGLTATESVRKIIERFGSTRSRRGLLEALDDEYIRQEIGSDEL